VVSLLGSPETMQSLQEVPGWGAWGAIL